MKKVAFSFLAITCLLLSACPSSVPQTASGGLWKVTMSRAGYERGFGIGPQKVDGLVIDLHLTYLGPDAKTKLPAVFLTRGVDPAPLAPAMLQTNEDDPADQMVMHLLVGGSLGTEFDLKTGQTLTAHPLSFLWDVPSSPGAVTLHVGDVPPIRVFP